MGIKTKTDQELLQMLANARTTGASCGGHGKAYNNERLCSDYKEELESRGVAIPTDRELFDQGKFNGEGSY